MRITPELGGACAQVSAVRTQLGELRAGLKRTEGELRLAQQAREGAPAGEAPAAVNAEYVRKLSAFHTEAEAQLAAAQVGPLHVLPAIHAVCRRRALSPKPQW